MKCPYCPVDSLNTLTAFQDHIWNHKEVSCLDICHQHAALLFKIQEKIAEWEIVDGDQDYAWKADVLKEIPLS